MYKVMTRAQQPPAAGAPALRPAHRTPLRPPLPSPSAIRPEGRPTSPSARSLGTPSAHHPARPLEAPPARRPGAPSPARRTALGRRPAARPLHPALPFPHAPHGHPASVGPERPYALGHRTPHALHPHTLHPHTLHPHALHSRGHRRTAHPPSLLSGHGHGLRPGRHPDGPRADPRRPVPAAQPRPTDVFAERLLAVLSGRRPVHSMLRHTVGRAYDELAWLAERGPLRARGPSPSSATSATSSRAPAPWRSSPGSAPVTSCARWRSAWSWAATCAGAARRWNWAARACPATTTDAPPPPPSAPRRPGLRKRRKGRGTRRGVPALPHRSAAPAPQAPAATATVTSCGAARPWPACGAPRASARRPGSAPARRPR